LLQLLCKQANSKQRFIPWDQFFGGLLVKTSINCTELKMIFNLHCNLKVNIQFSSDIRELDHQLATKQEREFNTDSIQSSSNNCKTNLVKIYSVNGLNPGVSVVHIV